MPVNTKTVDPLAMRADEVCEAFSISRKTLDRFLKAGMPHYRLGRRLLRFRRADLEGWLDSQRVQQPTAESSAAVTTGAAVNS